MALRLSKNIASDKPSYEITGDSDKLYDLDQIEKNKQRTADSDLAIQVNDPEELQKRLQGTALVRATYRAFYKIIINIFNDNKKIVSPYSEEFRKDVCDYMNKHLSEYVKAEYDNIILRLCRDTDEDGNLIYYKKQGLNLTYDDFKKYLLDGDGVENNNIKIDEFLNTVNNDGWLQFDPKNLFAIDETLVDDPLDLYDMGLSTLSCNDKMKIMEHDGGIWLLLDVSKDKMTDKKNNYYDLDILYQDKANTCKTDALINM